MRPVFLYAPIFLAIFTSCQYIKPTQNPIPSEITTPVIKSYDKSIANTFDLFYEKEIPLAKLEPSKGILLGAYILASENIGYSIKSFEKKVEKPHNQFVYNYTFGNDFNLSFILQCIACGKTPYIVIRPDLTDRYNLDNINKFCDKISSFHMNIFIELYPEPTEKIYDEKDYTNFYENAYKILNEKLANVAVIFTPDTDELYTSSLFFPGDNYCDWIGYSYFGTANPDKQNLYPDFFTKLDYLYKNYSDTKPIMISCYCLSHYTLKNHTYYLDNFSAKIESVYKSLLNKYPRVKGINYFDINGNLVGNTYKDDDFSIMDDDTVLKGYITAIGDNHFLSKSSKDNNKQLLSYPSKALKIEGIIYFSETTIINNFKIDPKIVNGYTPILVENKDYYSIDDVEKMDSNLKFIVDENNSRIVETNNGDKLLNTQ